MFLQLTPFKLGTYWLRRGEATILYQASLKRHRLLPDVPTLPELAQSYEGREVLHAAASTGEIGRSILTTPGVPPERVAVLRTAFQAMLRDPDFLGACEKRNLMVDGAAGEEIDEIVRETLRLPQAVAEKIGQMMREAWRPSWPVIAGFMMRSRPAKPFVTAQVGSLFHSGRLVCAAGRGHALAVACGRHHTRM